MEYSPQQNVPDQCKMRGSSRDIYSIEFDRIIHEKSAITSDAISTFFVIPTLEELRTSLGGKLSFVCWWAQRENSLYVGDRVQFFLLSDGVKSSRANLHLKKKVIFKIST